MSELKHYVGFTFDCEDPRDPWGDPIRNGNISLKTLKSFLAFRAKTTGGKGDFILTKNDPVSYFRAILEKNEKAFDAFTDWFHGDPCADGWIS